MSQAKLTDFFAARRRLPDQQPAKRRKIVLEDAEDVGGKLLADTQVRKNLFNDENDETNAQDVLNLFSNKTTKSPLKESAIFSGHEKNTEFTTDVVTSALDDHILATPLSTPSTRGDEGHKNVRRRSKGSPEQQTTPSTDGIVSTPAPKFTVGVGEVKSAKKKLQMSKGVTSREKSLIPFTQLGALSPKKRVQEVAQSNITQSPNKFRFQKLGNITPKKLDGSPRKSEQFKPILSPFKTGSPCKSEQLLFKPILSPFKPPVQPARKNLDISATRKNLAAALSNAKKLTPAEVKAKLGKVGKLADLKERLENLNAASQKLKQSPLKVNSIPKSEPVASLKFEIEVPASPSKRLHSPSPVKASPRKVPAYQRFHTLAQPLDRTLPLPMTYKVLADLFRCCDTVVAMLHNRQEIITYQKLKKGVEEMTRKNFGDKFLPQIKCVFPQAYHYMWEKVKGKFGNKATEHELQITANLTYKRDLLSEFSDKPEEKRGPFTKLGPELLVERRTIFHNSLLQMVKDHHKDFLASLTPPINVDDKKITKWHRDFEVDLCPEIDEEALPVEPVLQRLTSASEVLEKARDLFDINPKLSGALVNVADKNAANDQATPEEPLVAQPEIPSHLKGLNPKLVEKIRAKEAAKAQREMTRDSGMVKRLNQMGRLSDLARLLRSLFITEQKAALTMDFACKKLASSHKGQISPTEIDEDLRLMAKLINWVTFHVVRKVEYVKINSKKDINSVCKMLEDILKEHEKK